MALLTVACVILFLSISVVEGDITTVPASPEVTSYDMAGKITSSTVVLAQPYCYFTAAPAPCQTGCDIYVVPAVGSGVDNFNNDKKLSSSILLVSPYPSAFVGSSPKNYYLTRVGQLSSFPCVLTSVITYVRVGAQGNCGGTNCNGALPAGSSVRFKYVLLNSTSGQVLMDTNWSSIVVLKSVQSSTSLNVGLRRRSADMIVITSILCVLFGLLLALLILALICGRRVALFTDREPLPPLGSLRVKKYVTHNLQEPQAYTNSAYEDIKKYATDDVLPTSPKGILPELQDSVKLQRYQKFVN